MFVPPSPKNEWFNDLWARMRLKTEIPTLPPEICTQKTYNRWLIIQSIILILLGCLYYFLGG